MHPPRSPLAHAALVAVILALGASTTLGARQTGTAFLAGRVLDEYSGAPVPGVTVVLYPSPLGPVQIRTIVTNDRGEFDFGQLPPGSYDLEATKSGWHRGLLGRGSAVGPRGKSIDVARGERKDGLAILLTPEDGIAGTIRASSDSRSVAGVLVSALQHVPGEPRYVSSGVRRADTNGSYAFHGLTPGDYVICASDAGADTGATVEAERPREPRAELFGTQCYPESPTPDIARFVHVARGQFVEGIDLRVELVSATRVAGVVTGPQGPIGRAVVVTLKPAALASVEGAPQLERRAVADRASGAFEFPSVPAGDYVLTASSVLSDAAARDDREGQTVSVDMPVHVGAEDVRNLSIVIR